MQDLISGMASVGQPWVFAMSGAPGRTECWFGLAPAGDGGERMLRGVFPDVRFGIETFDGRRFGKFRHFAQLTGIPGRRDDRRREDSDDPMARLCRTLYGAEWMYAVVAAPVPSREVLRIRDKTLKDIWQLQTNYLQRGVGFTEQNRPAQLFSEMLEALLKRLDTGRQVGMWETIAMLAANDPGTLACGRGALQGVFAANMSLTEPIRTCLCASTHSQPEYRQLLNEVELTCWPIRRQRNFPGMNWWNTSGSGCNRRPVRRAAVCSTWAPSSMPVAIPAIRWPFRCATYRNTRSWRG